jgi:hypothetical protein
MLTAMEITEGFAQLKVNHPPQRKKNKQNRKKNGNKPQKK